MSNLDFTFFTGYMEVMKTPLPPRAIQCLREMRDGMHFGRYKVQYSVSERYYDFLFAHLPWNKAESVTQSASPPTVSCR